MKKTILITGSTDGIGLLSAKKLLSLGHKVLIHGRSSIKLNEVKETLLQTNDSQNIEAYLLDIKKCENLVLTIDKILEKVIK